MTRWSSSRPVAACSTSGLRARGWHRTQVMAALVVALVLVACGSDGDDDGGAVGSTAPADDVAGSTAVSSTMPPSTAETTPPTEVATTAAPPTTTGEPSVAWRTAELTDADRPSSPIFDVDGNLAFEGDDRRSIPTVILYPGVDGGGQDAPVADTAGRPLVVYLKGFGGRNGPTDPLLVRLAEAGYIVAAPDIREVSAPVNHVPGYVEQPGDARFVIDALTDPDDGFVDDLAPVVDPGRVGLVAHSIGAAGAFGLAYHDCCRDDRVDAVVAFGANPDLSPAEGDLEFAGTPLLLVYGSNDEISPVAFGVSALDVAEPPSHLLTLPGADHFQPVYGDGVGGDGDRAAETAATVGIGFLDLHVAGTTAQVEFDELTGSLEPGMWVDAEG